MFKKTKLTMSDIERQYASNASFADKLPWLEWSEGHQLMLLDDGASVGAAFELGVLPSENVSAGAMLLLQEKLQMVLSRSLPLEDECPWVVQLYLQKEQSLWPLLDRMKNYIAEKNASGGEFVKTYVDIHARHFKLLTRENGLFLDPMSRLPFRGNVQRLRMLVYRNVRSLKHLSHDTVKENQDTVTRLTAQLEQAGVRVARMTGRHVYEWLLRWFNPKPSATDGDTDALLEHFPYENPLLQANFLSFTERCLKGSVENSCHEGLKFDGLAHKALVFAPLEGNVPIGVVSAERQFGEGINAERYALFDKCPIGSIYAMQLVFCSKKTLNIHLDRLEKAAVGRSRAVSEVLKNIETARHEINENRHLLIRTAECLYIRENASQSVDTVETLVRSLFLESGMLLHDSQSELFPLDTYLRFLPFNFNPQFDAKYAFRSSYKYANEVAKLLPVYGRSRGDGQFPLMTYFNRGGEPFIFDFLNKDFKMTNSHVFIVGNTGSGKSVTLNQLCLSLAAVYRPYIIALEVGNSLGLTANYLQSQGVQTRSILFDYSGAISINPYADWKKAWATYQKEQSRSATPEQLARAYLENIESAGKNEAENENAEDDLEVAFRDVLNEMVLATRVMLTRGQIKEEENITLTDMSFINEALINAMRACDKLKRDTLLVEDVAGSFLDLSNATAHALHQARLHEFERRLRYYVQDNTRSQIINRHSTAIELQDFLHIDFGFMQQESYQDLLNIVCIALLSKILALAELNKSNNRPIVLIIDELHLFVKSKMLAVFLLLVAKVGRKFGLWLVLSTQNINDLSEENCTKMLSMIETWICLVLEPHEIALIEKFKQITPEIKHQLHDLRKYSGLFSEGFLLGKRYQGIFRNVPPRIALALAMTEQEERAARKAVQDEHKLTELEAVEWIARAMEEGQQKNGLQQGGFLWA